MALVETVAADGTSFLTAHDYLFGPVAAVLTLGAVLLTCRWVFSTSHRERAHAGHAPADFGLLVPVATPVDRADAERSRSLLAGHGLRATVSESLPPREPVRVTADGFVLPRPEVVPVLRVLVFPADAERARTLLEA